MAPQASGAEPDPAFAFIGVVVPDDSRFHGPAFNRAAQMFQEGLLDGLADAGFPHESVFSFEPTPAYPRGKRIFGVSGVLESRGGGSVRLLPFVNVQPLKWLTAGFSVMGALGAWTWRHRGQPRVMHCVNLTMPPGVFVWAIARLTRTKLLVSVLDVFKPGALVPDTFLRRLDFGLQRWLMPRFDGIMVVSKAIADDFVPDRRVCRIEGGISADTFSTGRVPSGAETVADQSVRPFRIVLAGSLEPYNGVEIALKAMTSLPASVELVVAGTGSLVDAVKAAAERDPRISYSGFVPFTEVVDLYHSADLLLNLRLTRAIDTRYFFPSKLMELLASGTPVLSTCTGHVEQEYGHVLYLLQEETPEGLTRRIMELAGLAARERQELGERARKFMLAEKTWQKQGQKLACYIRTEVLTREE
jgi:glycosyltransferase involved in cell wall biosynthesis